MKNNAFSRPAAFTLIELLVVIAVIVLLTGLGFVGMHVAMERKREKETVALIANIGRSVEEYCLDRGSYPRAVEREDTTITIDRESYRVAGAEVLYQALSGDGTDAIQAGGQVSTGTQGSAQNRNDPGAGRIYMDSVVAPTKHEILEKKHVKFVEPSGESRYHLVDSWCHPIQYQVAEMDKSGGFSADSPMHSEARFEAWSYGKLKKPEETAEAQKQWITTWKSR